VSVISFSATDSSALVSDQVEHPAFAGNQAPSSQLLTQNRGIAPFDPGIMLSPGTGDRLLNAREVAQTLGVSERWVRDHTTRRSPKIRGIKLGSLVRYRRADVELFMEKLDTQTLSRQSRFGV
jgi:excisionase family DNA binding protein